MARPNPRRLIGRLPHFMRGWVSYQHGNRPRDVDAWLMRVQRYRVMAQWHYSFAAPSAAEEALAAATAKGYEVAAVLEKHHFPLRNRASLVGRQYPRRVFKGLPRGLKPYIHNGEVRGYKVNWVIEYTRYSRSFCFANGYDLEDAIRFRDQIEREAVRLDENRMELFCELMSGLGAHLSDLVR